MIVTIHMLISPTSTTNTTDNNNNTYHNTCSGGELPRLQGGARQGPLHQEG